MTPRSRESPPRRIEAVLGDIEVAAQDHHRRPRCRMMAARGTRVLARAMLALLLAMGTETTSPASTPESVQPPSSDDIPSAQGLAPLRFQLDARIGLGALNMT